jgi:hypothetical protein
MRRVQRIDVGPGIGAGRALNRVAHDGVEQWMYPMFARALR